MNNLFELNQRKVGKKPVGRYKVDWSHYLTSGLQRAFYMGYDTTTRDIGRVGSNSTVTNGIQEFDSVVFDGSGWINCGINQEISADEYSVTFKGYVSSLATNSSLVNHDSSDSILERVFLTRVDASTGLLTFVRFGAANTVLDDFKSSVAVNVNENFIVTFAFKLGLGSYIYLNGKMVGFSDSFKDIQNNTTSATEPTYIGRRTAGGGAPDSVLVGGVNLANISDRFLSLSKIESLHRDPYQFLKPVRTIESAVYAALFSATVGAEATGSLQPVNLTALSAVALGSIIAVGALAPVNASALSASANGTGATATLKSVNVSNLTATASGGINAVSDLQLVSVSKLLATANGTGEATALLQPIGVSSLNGAVTGGINASSVLQDISVSNLYGTANSSINASAILQDINISHLDADINLNYYREIISIIAEIKTLELKEAQIKKSLVIEVEL